MAGISGIRKKYFVAYQGAVMNFDNIIPWYKA
jgi:hypothetical protein